MSCPKCDHWRTRALESAHDLERIIELTRDRDLWKQQARDLHQSSADTPGPYEAHLYLVAAQEAERRLDQQGTRLAMAERIVRTALAGHKPKPHEVEAWRAATKETPA